MRRRVVLAIVVGLLFGCGDDDEPNAMGDPTEAVTAPYALLVADGWILQEAIDPPAGDPVTSFERPPLSWYIEYVRRPSENESQMVRVSGHAAPLDEARGALEPLGFEFSDIAVVGWRAIGGTSIDPTGPPILLLENGDDTVMLLSYEIDLDELAQLAGSVQPADAAAWGAAGGVVTP